MSTYICNPKQQYLLFFGFRLKTVSMYMINHYKFLGKNIVKKICITCNFNTKNGSPEMPCGKLQYINLHHQFSHRSMYR
jgi:hypothetical protein